MGEDQRMDIRRLLAAVEAAPPVEAVDVLAVELATMVDALDVTLLIADTTGSAVMRLSHVTAPGEQVDGRNERAESHPLPGSRYGQVMVSQQLHVERRGGGSWSVVLPGTERGDAIGLLELTVPQHPDVETLEYLVAAAHALAYVLIASRRHTDLFEWAQRDQDFSLAAEIQRRLLPSSYTLEAGPLTIAGWLEPAHRVGGDTFDDSLDREHLYASITDAMGHSSQAALLATLVVGSLRNSRRRLVAPAEQAAEANRVLLEETGDDEFATGHLLRLRLSDGLVEMVNAGHPAPYLVRRGELTEVALDAGLAFGIAEADYGTASWHLEPGDRLLLLTDGYLERGAAGVDIGAILTGSLERHPREVVRELADHVLEATGRNLRDDATALCIDWYGGSASRRVVGGATAGLATGA
jgi:serine phosphatase RsbU (regulator of sigma subunit)